jgi:hypothetical protein
MHSIQVYEKSLWLYTYDVVKNIFSNIKKYNINFDGKIIKLQVIFIT